VLGKKILIGKYKKRTGYKRHNGFRARLSQVEIEAIGKASRPAKPSQATEEKPQAAPKPKAAAEKKPAPKKKAE
jgi:hypothetical protein